MKAYSPMTYDNDPNLQSSIDPLPETISFLLQMQIFQGLEWEYEKSGIFFSYSLLFTSHSQLIFPHRRGKLSEEFSEFIL